MSKEILIYFLAFRVLLFLRIKKNPPPHQLFFRIRTYTAFITCTSFFLCRWKFHFLRLFFSPLFSCFLKFLPSSTQRGERRVKLDWLLYKLRRIYFTRLKQFLHKWGWRKGGWVRDVNFGYSFTQYCISESKVRLRIL